MAANPGMTRKNKVFSFEFTKDGKFISKRDNKESLAVYTIKKSDGENLTLDAKSVEGEEQRTEELVLTVWGNKLEMTVDMMFVGRRRLIFTR